MLCWLTFWYYKSLLLARIIIFNFCLLCDLLGIIYKYFIDVNKLYAPLSYKLVTYICTCLFQLAKTLFVLVYSRYYYTYFVCQRWWRLESLCNFIPMLMWNSGICFIKFLLFFDRDSTFKRFYVIYLLDLTISEW